MDRLTEFGREMVREAHGEGAGVHLETTAQDTIDFQEVCLDLPDGAPLLASVTLSLRPHEAVLLKGSSGCGKSTLFRVLTGLWPFATGRIRLPVACGCCPAAAALHADRELARGAVVPGSARSRR